MAIKKKLPVHNNFYPAAPILKGGAVFGAPQRRISARLTAAFYSFMVIPLPFHRILIKHTIHERGAKKWIQKFHPAKFPSTA